MMKLQGTRETSLTLLLAAQLLIAVKACPDSNFQVRTDNQTFCARFYSTPMTFCKAVETCHSNGQEMISKQVFDAMKSSAAFSGSDGGSQWWVGLVDALNERGTNKSGWAWIMDGQVTTEADGYFLTTEPDDSDHQDCANVNKTNKLLSSSRCTETLRFFCYNATLIADPSNAKFEMSQIVDYVQPDPGCWILKSGIDSGIECAAHCVSFGRDCVGFYWNSVRRECIVLPYFDATAPLNFANDAEKMQWQKFVRVG